MNQRVESETTVQLTEREAWVSYERARAYCAKLERKLKRAQELASVADSPNNQQNIKDLSIELSRWRVIRDKFEAAHRMLRP